MLDMAIIGTGPAGLSAAINAKARNKEVAVFGRNPNTSWLYRAEEINNHLGMINAKGQDMVESFLKHAESLDIPVNYGRVQQIMPFGDFYMINFDNDIIQARTIVIATGMTKVSSVKNETEYLGKGLSYCATCDGMLYRGKDVVVVGEIEEGEEDANFLSEICKSVTYVHTYDNVGHVNDNVKLIKGKLKEIHGEELVTSVVVDDKTIECEGLFYIKASIPMGTLITGLEVEDGAIKVNRLCETNIKGIYAAGDCTGWPYQVSKSVGEGLVAAQQGVKYLNQLDNQKK